MLYAKTIIRHLAEGGIVEDWMDGDPGLCCNGGRYFDMYKIYDGILMIRSSYEDAEWQEAGFTVKEFAEWVRKHFDDTPMFVKPPRFNFC